MSITKVKKKKERDGNHNTDSSSWRGRKKTFLNARTMLYVSCASLDDSDDRDYPIVQGLFLRMAVPE